jgi:hypothetical protein
MPITPVIRIDSYPRTQQPDVLMFIHDALAYLLNNPFAVEPNQQYTPALDVFRTCEDMNMLENARLLFDIVQIKLLLVCARRGGRSSYIATNLDAAITRLMHHTNRRRIELDLYLNALRTLDQRLPEHFSELESRLVENAPPDPDRLLSHLVRLAIYSCIQQYTLNELIDSLQAAARDPETGLVEVVREEILALDFAHDRPMGLFLAQIREGLIFPQVSPETRDLCANAFIHANENVARLYDIVRDVGPRGRPFVLFPAARRLPHPGVDNFIAAFASIVDRLPLTLSPIPNPEEAENLAQHVVPRFEAWRNVVVDQSLALITGNRQNPLTPLVTQVDSLNNEVIDLTSQVATAAANVTFSVNFINMLVAFVETDQRLKATIAEVLNDPATQIPIGRIPEIVSILGRSTHLIHQNVLTILRAREMVANANEGSPILHLGAWVHEDTGTAPQVEAANGLLDAAMHEVQNRIVPPQVHQPAHQPAYQLTATEPNWEASIFAGAHYQDNSGFRLLVGLKVANPLRGVIGRPSAHVSLKFEKAISNQLPWSGKGFGLNIGTKMNNDQFALSHQTFKTGPVWDTSDTLSVAGPARNHITTFAGILACETGATGFRFSHLLPGSGLFSPFSSSKACRFVAPVISVGTDLRAEDRWSFILTDSAVSLDGGSRSQHLASTDTAFLKPKTGLVLNSKTSSNIALLLRDTTLIDLPALVRSFMSGVMLLVLIRTDSEGRHPAIKCLSRVLMINLSGAYMGVTIFSVCHMAFNTLTGRGLYWKSLPVRKLFVLTEDLCSGTMTQASDDSIYKLFNFVSVLFCFQYVRNYILACPRSRLGWLILLQMTIGFALIFVVTPQVRRWIQHDE